MIKKTKYIPKKYFEEYKKFVQNNPFLEEKYPESKSYIDAFLKKKGIEQDTTNQISLNPFLVE